ncbi:MAG: Ig-like domain-containing protein [Thermaerobacter sp.]|nr:Ig-like domain-containing protein [Thermaerobacter sp.]
MGAALAGGPSVSRSVYGNAYAASYFYPIPLAAYFNNQGIGTGTNGEGSYDGNGDSYVGADLPSGGFDVMVNGQAVDFEFPLNTQLTDNVQESGQTVAVNAPASYPVLWILGSANDIPYTYASTSLTLNYADGTSQTDSFQISDWVLPGSYYPNDEVVVYRDPYWLLYGQKVPAGTGKLGGKNTHFYLVGVPVNPAEPVSSITLGTDGNVHLWALTLSQGKLLQPPILSLAASDYQPTVGSAVYLTATLTDVAGNPVSGQTVNFHVVSAGAGVTLSSPQGVTGSTGQATVTADNVLGGPATFQASYQGLDSRVTVDWLGTAAVQRILISASRRFVLADGRMKSTITATVYGNASLPLPGIPVAFATNLGSLTPSTPQSTDAAGQAFTVFTAHRKGIATITASVYTPPGPVGISPLAAAPLSASTQVLSDGPTYSYYVARDWLKVLPGHTHSVAYQMGEADLSFYLNLGGSGPILPTALQQPIIVLDFGRQVHTASGWEVLLAGWAHCSTGCRSQAWVREVVQRFTAGYEAGARQIGIPLFAAMVVVGTNNSDYPWPENPHSTASGVPPARTGPDW